MAIKIGEYFVQLGKLTREQLAEALERQKKAKQRAYLGEMLVGDGTLAENDLLAYLAGIFNIQYISSEKLEKMVIQSNIAQILPEKIAESKTIFPLKYSFNEGKLTLLTYEPQNTQALDELKIILDNIKHITPVIAYSKAIRALIAKQYRGDLIAFDRFFPKSVDMRGFIPVGEPVLDKDMLKQDSPRKAVVKDPRGNTSFTQIINQGEVLQASGEDTTITNRINRLQNGITIAGHEEFIEVIKVFTSIIDSIREGGFKNHTQRVVALCMKLAKAMKFNEVDLNDLILAAYLHDVGKKKHLVALDLKDRAHADTFIKYASAGPRLLAGCNLPKQTKAFLSSMYEVVNGEGHPQGLKDGDIPNGSQILLLADTFDFMTQVSGIPAATAFSRLRTLGHFTDKLLDILKDELQITLVQPAKSGGQLAKVRGIVVSENRTLLEDTAQLIGGQNVQVLTAPQIEIAALMLKKQGDAIAFVLADLDVKNSQYTPFKLVSAVRAKNIFPHIKFLVFSTGAITTQTRDQAKQLQITALFPNFDPRKSLPDIMTVLAG